MNRIGGRNYSQKSSFFVWCSIIFLISLSVLRNEQNRWTDLWWEVFIFHAMFDHVIHLASSSSKSAEFVDTTILRNLHFSCDVRSSFWSHFLFFEMSRIGEQIYEEKSSFWCDVRPCDSSRILFFEMRRIGELNCRGRSSFVMWCSIIFLISLSVLRNEQNSWTELWWKIFLCNVMFDYLFDLTFCSSKWTE